MSKTNLTESLSNHIKPVNDGSWDESVDAMHNYLTLLKKHAETKAEKAEVELAEHEVDLQSLKVKRQQRRNYGTHTGIALQKGADTEEEEDD